MADAPIVPVSLLIVGGYLTWFGVHYFGSDVKYPTTPVKSVLQGGTIPASSGANPSVHTTLAADVQALQPDPQPGQQPPASSQDVQPAGKGGGGTPDQNKTLAKMIAISMGHSDWTTGSQWTDWESLWQGESGWSQFADTRKTGLSTSDTMFAYGIPQSYPYSKMPKAGWPADKGGSSDPRTQITWGIEYIASTYSSPSSALAFKVSHGNKGY